MQRGIIVELTARESGFIKRDAHAEPLFFHSDDLRDVSFANLIVGDTLQFKVQETNKGPYAIEVRRVEAP